MVEFLCDYLSGRNRGTHTHFLFSFGLRPRFFGARSRLRRRVPAENSVRQVLKSTYEYGPLNVVALDSLQFLSHNSRCASQELHPGRERA